MLLTIDRDALFSALDRAGKVVEKRASIPILGNVLLAAHDGRLMLTGTDLDMEATTRADADVSAPGETTLPAAMLHDFVRKLPSGGRVTLEQKEGEARCAIRAGRSRALLNAMPPVDFPAFSAGEFPARFRPPAAALARMIERTGFAASTEETRYYLNGIFLHVAGGADGMRTLRAVATDGHRLALQDLDLPEGAGEMPAIIIPRKAVNEIARLIKVLGEEPLEIAASPTKLQVRAGATTLTTKLIDGTFPDYDRVIPSGGDKLADVDHAALAAAVDRVGTLSSERGRAVKFAFGGEVLTLSVRSSDAGDATEELDITYGTPAGGEAPPLEIGFNGSYVQDIARVLPGATARLALSDPGSPCLITAEGHDDCRFVLMPMRV